MEGDTDPNRRLVSLTVSAGKVLTDRRKTRELVAPGVSHIKRGTCEA
jgi:hypothetical protein